MENNDETPFNYIDNLNRPQVFKWPLPKEYRDQLSQGYLDLPIRRLPDWPANFRQSLEFRYMTRVKMFGVKPKRSVGRPRKHDKARAVCSYLSDEIIVKLDELKAKLRMSRSETMSVLVKHAYLDVDLPTDTKTQFRMSVPKSQIRDIKALAKEKQMKVQDLISLIFAAHLDSNRAPRTLMAPAQSQQTKSNHKTAALRN